VCAAPNDICPLLETVASGRHEVAEHVHYGVGGEKLFVEVSTSPIRDKDGRIIQVAHVSRDITERKRGEVKLQRYAAELQETNKELTAFTNLVSHDLRAPLVNIKGFTDELELTLLGVEGSLADYIDPLDERAQNLLHKAFRKELPEALQFIKASAGRMDSLINAMLKLARFGNRRLRLESVDMNDLMQIILESHFNQREQHIAQMTVGWLPEVVADRIAMGQIMEYLLDNALKYLMPDRPGVIEIIAERGEKETTFQIRDNGRGIAADDLTKVFEMFRRAGQHAVPGEGMGLAYVKTLVRRHGGQLWCESELGVGSTFSFSIPHKPDIED
jgi:signal transduction histidine kinase